MLNRLGTEITQVGWFPRRGLFDISTIIVGTFVVVLIAMAVAVPLGLGAAIYLAEFAQPRVRRVVKPILEILAGIPSVVLAYFAIAFINPNIVVRLFDPRDQGLHDPRRRDRRRRADRPDHRIGRRGCAARRADVVA